MVSFRYILFLVLNLAILGSCGRSYPTGKWTTHITRDQSIKYSVVVILNPGREAAKMTFLRKGLKDTHITIPPFSVYRTLLAPGLWKFEMNDSQNATNIYLKPHHRYRLKL